MSYISFSLKYRPQRFEDLVGQDHVSRTLMNAVKTNRVAHAYLFSGPRGTGKTSTARVLAKALNCVDGPTPTPCGVCDSCISIQDGRAMDVIEIDAASNRGIDEIRDLREKVKYSPAEARSKIYILDEVHMLTTEAFNALLKTLEEPPAHAFFVLATTEPHKVPATIMSRCQRFDLRQIPVPKIVEALARIAEQEGISADTDALDAIARAADGAMRDAQSIFDQVVAYTDGEVTLAVVHSVLGVTESETLAEIADLIVACDVPGSFALVDRVLAAGKDVSRLLADLTIYIRDLLRIALGSEPSVWRLPGEEGRERMTRQAQAIGSDRLLAAVHDLAADQGRLRSTTQHALLLELSLAKQCQPATADAPMPAPRQAPAPQPTAATPTPPPPAAPATTPPAQAPPPPAQPVASGDITLDTIIAHWQTVPDELKRMGRLPVGAFIREGTPSALNADTLTVTFDPQYTFHHSQVSGSYRPVVEEALQRLFGRKISITCRLADKAADAPAAQPEPEPSVAEPQPAPEPEPPPAEPQPAPEPEPPAAEPEAPQAPPEAAAQGDAVVDTAVEQTLSLFEGSRELGDDE